jgi:hypothetical protein
MAARGGVWVESMSAPEPVSPFEAAPPSRGQLLRSIAIAAGAAGLVLLLVVLPAEYNIDPTGAGRALGLTRMQQNTRTLQIKDVIGGNEHYREIEIPDAGQPIPLPNPAVFQAKSAAAPSKSLSIRLEPAQETEIKAVLDEGQVILFAWSVAQGEVYSDFHGHEPTATDRAFVRYEEQQSGTRGQGSLVAPFTGEHGWYWVNVSEQPVIITLDVSGYYKDIVDYGILKGAGG